MAEIGHQEHIVTKDGDAIIDFKLKNIIQGV
jgi:hypothetical protein